MTRFLVDRRSFLGINRKQLQTLYVVAAACLAALVPLILFAGFWVRAELGKSQRDVDLVLGTRAASLSQRIDGEIEQQLSAMRALTALPSLDQDSRAFEEAAGRLVRVMPHWSDLSLVNAGSGEVLFTTGSGGGSPQIAAVREAAASRKPLVETQATGSGTRGGVNLYMPVLRNDSAQLVLAMGFDVSDVQDIVNGQRWDMKLISAVIDRSGRVMARSSTDANALGSTVPPDLRSTLAGGTKLVPPERGSYQRVASGGESLRGAFVTSALTGWSTLAEISQPESERLMSRSVWATVAAGLLSIALVGILAVFIVHTVMERRVSEERLSASRALGELDARLLTTTKESLDEQRKASSEREVLLREIYHRVKNNLQIVQSLLRLGSRDLKADQREPFENAVRRIGAMARVHTLLYNSPDLASIDFKDYLDELLKELSEGFSAEEREIASVLHSEPMRMPLDTAVPLAFIAVEILTNSFKHAFPAGRSGMITVEIERTDGDALLKIRDDGIGMGSGDASKRRLGLTIVRKLVQQIGGTLEEPLAGSSVFVVRFPLNLPTEPGPLPSAPAMA